jgi:hypothetical protein
VRWTEREQRADMAKGSAHKASAEVCYVCRRPADTRCERCERPICATHTTVRPKMSWQHFSSGGGRGGVTWRRYLPDGDWRLCPACADAVAAVDAREQVRDRSQMLALRIGYVLTGLAIVAACSVVLFLGTH